MNRKLLIQPQWLFFAGAIVSATLLGLALPEFLRLVVAWGHKIPQPDLQGDYVTACIWATVLGASIFIWPVPSQDKRILFKLWLVRCFVTLGFMLLYENYYGLDAYYYFASSLQDNFPWEEVGLGSGTANITALCWLHNQVFPATYHSLKVSFSLLGLLAVYIFYRSSQFLMTTNNNFLYILGLFPSILFWSSILGKDPIVLLGIALYIYGVCSWYKSKKWQSLILLAMGVTIAAIVRIWLGPILLFPLIIFAVSAIRRTVPRLLFVAVAIAAFLLTINQFTLYFGLESTADTIATANNLSQGLSQGGSAQEVPEITNLSQMIAFVPVGIFTVLFRPLPGEVLNPFGLLAGIENLLLLGLFGRAVTRIRWQTLRSPLTSWAIILVLTWSTIYGFFSSNLGAAVRFKLQILPMLLILLLYLMKSRYRLPKSRKNITQK